MELTITKDLMGDLKRLGLLNESVAADLAREVLAQKEPLDLARWLLSPTVAVELLKDRLLADPEQTLVALEQLPARTSPLPKRGRKAKRPAPKAKRPAKATRAVVKDPPGKRRRLSPTRVKNLKEKVTAFLKDHPGSGRKAIEEAVTFPSLPAYQRILRELQETGVVRSEGERRKTVYFKK